MILAILIVVIIGIALYIFRDPILRAITGDVEKTQVDPREQTLEVTRQILSGGIFIRIRYMNQLAKVITASTWKAENNKTMTGILQTHLNRWVDAGQISMIQFESARIQLATKFIFIKRT